jgi:short-subunit dehydrogenase
MKNLNQTRWIITGAGSGIGRLIALRLAQKGAILALLDRNQSSVEELTRQIQERSGKAHAFVADLQDLPSLQAAKVDILKILGGVEGLINNAGVVHGGAFEAVSFEKHNETYATNVVGAVAMTHLFYAELLGAREAHLVNVASAAGLIPFPYAATYGSSKWALIGFSESIRGELKARNHVNFHVTTVCPGYIATGMFAGAKPPPVTPWLDPEKLADIIVRGIERNKVFIKEPFLVKTVDFQKGILPLFIQDQMYKILGFSKSMLDWKGRR